MKYAEFTYANRRLYNLIYTQWGMPLREQLYNTSYKLMNGDPLWHSLMDRW